MNKEPKLFYSLPSRKDKYVFCFVFSCPVKPSKLSKSNSTNTKKINRRKAIAMKGGEPVERN